MAKIGIKDIITTSDRASEVFDKAVSTSEQKMFDEVLLLIKNLETTPQGNIKTSIANLKRVQQIRSKLYRLANNKDYLQAVRELVGTFDTLYRQQLQFYAAKNQSTVTEQKHNLVKTIARENTIAALTGDGLAANVTTQLDKMLLRAVTSGARFADLQKELSDYLLTNEGGNGALSRYAKTYAVTALSQYAGQNNKLFTDDLDTEWYEYVGSEIETTRPFCEACLKKRYIHRSEFHNLLRGHIHIVGGDDIDVKLYDKTDLPYGMIDGTNEENLQINVGGWNCRHQLIPIAAEAVPENIRKEIESNPQPKEKSLWQMLYEQNKDIFEYTIAKAKIYGVETTKAYDQNISTREEFMKSLRDIDYQRNQKEQEYSTMFRQAELVLSEALQEGYNDIQQEAQNVVLQCNPDNLKTNVQYESNKSLLKSAIRSLLDKIQAYKHDKPYKPNLTQAEQAAIDKNNITLEKLLGIVKGAQMSIERADKQSANPKHVSKYIPNKNGEYKDSAGNKYSLNPDYNPQRDRKYSINCATCVPAFLLRTRGFNISAKACVEKSGSMNEKISKGAEWYKMWKNIDGTPAEIISIKDFMQLRNYKQMTPDRYREFFELACNEDGLYELSIGWKKANGGGGHATIIQRDNGNLYRIEPQEYNEYNGVRFTIDSLCKQGETMPHAIRGIVRIDNKVFDTDYANLFVW